MQKPSILYYLHTYFMDSALEWLSDLKSNYDVHLVVELSPDSIKSTVINIDSRIIDKDFGDLFEVLDETTKQVLAPYLQGMTSIKYVFYPTKQMISFKNLAIAFKVLFYIKRSKIDMIHFDTTSGRLMPVLPFLFSLKRIATIHDPAPHTGEESLKKTIIKMVYNNLITNYLVYSRYSYQQFIFNNRQLHFNLFTAQLKPYSYISRLDPTVKQESKYILYFGRISYYKGIDLLIEAYKALASQYPNLTLIIAGKGSIDYMPTDNIHIDSIRLLNKYVSIQELAELIQNAEFIVCPYREATQSGVLMTAFALNKPVLATNVGAFPEYVVENVNGMLVEPTVNGIEKGILTMLNNNHYKDIEIQMKSFALKRIVNNENVFSELYAN